MITSATGPLPFQYPELDLPTDNIVLFEHDEDRGPNHVYTYVTKMPFDYIASHRYDMKIMGFQLTRLDGDGSYGNSPMIIEYTNIYNGVVYSFHDGATGYVGYPKDLGSNI